MGPEIVTVSAGGGRWTAFEKISVHRKFSHAAGSFTLEIAAEAGGPATFWVFSPGTPVEIFSNGDLLLAAYIDRYQPKLVEHKHAGASVSGRSKGQDFIDSAAIHATGEFKNKTPAEIGQALDQFGVGVSTDQALDKVPVYRITPGETAFRVVEKLCRSQGVWCSHKADGSLVITIAGQGRNGALIEGQNIKRGEADHNWANRHSHVIVRGQRPVGHGVQAMEIQADSHDESLQRNRPVLLIQDDDTDKQRAQKRADHRRDSEAGNSLRANITVQGFHDDGGALWQPGNLMFLDSPFLGISQDMAIDGVEYMQSRHEGSLTRLALVDPRALGAKSGRKGGKSNKAWASSAGSG